jgi:hypothetical protein
MAIVGYLRIANRGWVEGYNEPRIQLSEDVEVAGGK